MSNTDKSTDGGSAQERGRVTRGGYWGWVLEETRDPVTGERTGQEYFFLGAHVLFSPIEAPLYWLGRLAAAVLEDNDGRE